MDADMTPLELRDAVTWMTSRWPSSQRDWGDWESFTVDFEPYSVGSLKETLHNWFRRGEARAPNPSQLISEVASTHARRVARGVEEVDRSCLGNHVWADPQPYDEDRHRVCVLCGETGAVVRCDHGLVFKGSRLCAYCPETVGVS